MSAPVALLVAGGGIIAVTLLVVLFESVVRGLAARIWWGEP
jgi:hypothetical protein